MTPLQALEYGYLTPRQLPGGRILALSQQLFTIGLVIMDEGGITHRWCYEDVGEATLALMEWDLRGDPPGMWIKQKLPVERMNPNWSRG